MTGQLYTPNGFHISRHQAPQKLQECLSASIALVCLTSTVSSKKKNIWMRWHLWLVCVSPLDGVDGVGIIAIPLIIDLGPSRWPGNGEKTITSPWMVTPFHSSQLDIADRDRGLFHFFDS
jgi:hypothetical protein